MKLVLTMPIAPAGSRAPIVDALVFALEHREALHGMLAKARSRPAARRSLVRESGLPVAQANAVLDLRWWQSIRAVQRELEVELRDWIRPVSGTGGRVASAEAAGGASPTNVDPQLGQTRSRPEP